MSEDTADLIENGSLDDIVNHAIDIRDLINGRSDSAAVIERLAEVGVTVTAAFCKRDKT